MQRRLSLWSKNAGRLVGMSASVNADSGGTASANIVQSFRTACTAAWVPIVPPKFVDCGDSIGRTSQRVGRLHQRHLKPTQCPTIRAISRKIDTTVRTTPTSHPSVASLPIVFREGQCSLWSMRPGLLRKPLRDRCVLLGYDERGSEQPTSTACNGALRYSCGLNAARISAQCAAGVFRTGIRTRAQSGRQSSNLIIFS